jgi:lipopolysaccharide/colanic/teichoic acid biosynthesis glycosyltransferase
MEVAHDNTKVVIAEGFVCESESSILKRLMDIAIASVGLVCLSPILLLTAVAIKLSDGGPVLHRRRCVGLNGKEFDAFKFRSMRVDADDILRRDPELRKTFEQNFKLQSDPRITSIGRFIRKTSIDELPQLWNILTGEMSAVGPRMITRQELQKYGDSASLLLTVKPGLTGFWQTEGRQTTSYEQRVQMDIYYIRNWSLSFDVRVLLRTPSKVFKGEGAY